ncbi:MAG: hypothetical protein GF364_05925 [Candidatus Lokiarchaeota archaeon]|nr:hypothetical protein [Candidatus Lokiarchaeota archaeon]
MSSYFGVSISTEYVIALHRESKGIMYIKNAPGVDFDAELIEKFRRAINFEEIELPTTEGDIEQASIKGKYVIIRAGKMIFVAIIINQKPNRFSREALHSFGIRFESRWGREINKFYDEHQGDVKIFHEHSDTRASVDDLIEDVFHLNLSLPHKLGLPLNKIKDKLTRAVWGIAENLVRGRGYIFLSELVEAAKNNLSREVVYINDSIFELCSRGLLIPIPLDEFIEKYQKV